MHRRFIYVVTLPYQSHDVSAEVAEHFPTTGDEVKTLEEFISYDWCITLAKKKHHHLVRHMKVLENTFAKKQPRAGKKMLLICRDAKNDTYLHTKP